jgi:hypothetical protein
VLLVNEGSKPRFLLLQGGEIGLGDGVGRTAQFEDAVGATACALAIEWLQPFIDEEDSIFVRFNYD